MNRRKSRQSGRTVMAIDDEDGYRFFVFDDCQDVIAQHPVDCWDEHFEELTGE